MLDRRRFLSGSLLPLAAACAGNALAQQGEEADIDRLGKFQRVPGRPGIVIGVPHGSADSGTLQAGRIVCERLGFSGVLVTGFWDGKTRQRINVNRATEQLIGESSKVLQQWATPRAKGVNARYEKSVMEAAQGPLRVFYELHSNHRPDMTGSVQVATGGVSRAEAARVRDAFMAAMERLPADVPRLVMNIAPIDLVKFPNYRNSSSVSGLAAKGCLIEHPGRVVDNKQWCAVHAGCLADAIRAGDWR